MPTPPRGVGWRLRPEKSSERDEGLANTELKLGWLPIAEGLPTEMHSMLEGTYMSETRLTRGKAAENMEPAGLGAPTENGTVQ